MIDIDYADAYFGEHPLGERYFAFERSARAAAVAAAGRDIRAALGREAEEDDDAFAAAAVCEQALHVLLHPELFTMEEAPRLVSEAVNGIGRRSYRYGNAAADPRLARFAPRAVEYLEAILGGGGTLRVGR